MYKNLMFIIVIGLLFSSCSEILDNDKEKKKTSEYLGMQHSGCLNDVLKKTAMPDFYLADWDYNNGLLLLDINYYANCCLSSFIDSVDFDGDIINLFLRVEGQGCYCTCPYTIEYAFQLNRPSPYKVLFHLQDLGKTDYVTRIDTLINVK